MISVYTFVVAGATALAAPAPIAITCQIDIVSIGYHGDHANLQPTSPTRRSLRTSYIVDFEQPSLTLEGPDYRMVTTNDPAKGSSIIVGPNGMNIEVTREMTGGFVIRNASHFNKDGSGGSMTKDIIARGAVVEHEEGRLTCHRRP